MRHLFLATAALAACAGAPEPGADALPTSQGGPPSLPFIENDAVYGGVRNDFLVITEPGAPAALWVSTFGTGRSCPSLISPICLGIKRAFFIGQGVADGSGAVFLSGRAPSGFPGDTVTFQAASLLSSGGTLSQVTVLPYYDTCVPPASFSIPNGAVDVAVDRPIAATWTEQVAPFQSFQLNGQDQSSDSSYFTAEITGATLDYDTAYTVTVIDPCGNETSISFTTEEEPAFGSTLVDRGWALDFTNAEVTSPASLNQFKDQLLGALTSTYVLGVTSYDEGAATLDFGFGTGVLLGTEIVQDECSETTAFPGADFSGSPTVTSAFSLPEIADLLDYAELEATFSADGTTISPVVVDAWIPALAAAEAAGLTGLPEGLVCLLLPGVLSGVSCQTCPVNTSVQCIAATLGGITGAEISGGFSAISAADVTGNPACALP